jgi:two-component system CheB/CheR fusion protein
LIEREVASSEGEKMLFVRILPYAIPSSTGRGAVTSFVDVSAYHDAKRLQAILDGLPEHVAVLGWHHSHGQCCMEAVCHG